MKFQRFSIFIFLFYSSLFKTSGQIHENAIPFSFTENLTPVSDFVELPHFDTSICKKNSKSAQYLPDQLQFACPVYTNLNPYNSGKWQETGSGRVWRLGIQSDNAYSLYIVMQFQLLPDVKMFVYGPDYIDLHGAFTYRNNNSSETMAITPVRGNKIIIELNLPANQHTFGKVNISKIFHDYINIFKPTINKSLKSYSDCNEDINCSNGMYWQTEKRAVCKIITNGGLGTGTLIGNTSLNNTPYILTARHLITSDEIAAEAIFSFNYETTGCNDSTNTLDQSLIGAKLISTTDNKLDFALLKLYEIPPPSYKPFFCGWDAQNRNSETGVCIHHPFGKTKQIAIEYHPVLNEDIGMGFDANSTWKVRHWDLGTTESGSSGAPLFNDQHRIIGTLTGGRSSCGYTKDDYFTKVGTAWNNYPDSSNQLKYWLDPDRTGQLTLDGYDPYGFNEEYCDTAWNYTSNDKLGLSNADLTWGWISGHNSEGYTQFAERFESKGPIKITGAYLNVAKSYSSNSLNYIELKIWEGNQFPEKESYSRLIFIKDLLPNKVNYISFDSILNKSGRFFIGYKIRYNEVADTFALYHVIDRSNLKASSMYIFNEKWYQAKDQNALGISTSLALGISECYGKSRQPVTNVLNVYPNPCSNSTTLEIPEGNPIQDVQCFDINGRAVSIVLKQSETNNKLYFNLKTGIYFLKIITAKKLFTTKLIVIRQK